MRVSDIFEATFNTDEIVDYIYDNVFADYIKKIQEWKNGKTTNEPVIISNKTFEPEKLSKEIKDPVFKKAMKENPIKIKAGVRDGNYYYPTKHLISITFNDELYAMMNRYISANKSFMEFIGNLPLALRKNILTEVNGNKVKGSISHEISHWLDDTNNQKHITKMINVAAGEQYHKQSKTFNRGEADQYMTDYEINAQTHALKQLKRSIGQEAWDKLTFNDLYAIEPSLRVNKERISKISPEALKRFVKLTLRRMHRENLLGKNMTGRISPY